MNAPSRRPRLVGAVLLRVAFIGGLVGAAAIALRSREVAADLENQVFTSKADDLRIVVPRSWRATEQPSYPSVLLWMMRSDPDGRIALTAEPFTHAMYCAWPVACRTSRDGLAAKYACALRERLATENMKLGAVQAGPKDNEAVGMASVWFEYDDGRRFLRQAVAITHDRAVSLVLSAGSVDARATLARPFDQALRTLRPLTGAELAGSATAADAPGDAGAPAAHADGGGPIDAGAGFASAPAPAQDAVGPCR